MKWQTKLTRAFPCRVPIVGAPMAGVAGGLLAAETCRAGGLGFIAAGYLQDMKAVEDQIDIFRQQQQSESSSSYPLCLGFLGFGTLSTEEGWERYEKLLEEHQPAVVQFFAPTVMYHPETGLSNVDLAHQYRAKFLAQIGNIQELHSAIKAGVDGIIVQGSEAGGHGLRPGLGSGTLPLVSKVVSMTDLPVIAAGGIVNGKGVAAALALCDGAVLGTRLWASRESIGKPALQQQLLKAESPDDVIRTPVFDAIENHFLPIPWPYPYDSVGTLRNKVSDHWDLRPEELKAELSDPSKSQLLIEYSKAQAECNTDVAKVLSGEGVGEINSIEPAYDIITKIEAETIQVIQRMNSLLIQEA